MDKQQLCQSLERASSYLLGIQDADMWPEDETAADLIRILKNEIELLDGWDGIVSIDMHGLGA